MLAVNDIRSTIRILVKTNELYIAYQLAKHLDKSVWKEVAYLLLSRAERFFQIELV